MGREIGSVVGELLREEGVTVSELAALTGRSADEIVDILRGRGRYGECPEPETLRDLEAALGVRPGFLDGAALDDGCI